MDNRTVAHRFFYSDFNDSCDYRHMSVSYYNNLFYSYYTVIGAVVKTKDNQNILLVSSNNMSATTSKHIGILKSACPFNYIPVPFHYGEHYFSLSEVIRDLIKYIDYDINERKLTQQANRIELNNDFNSLKDILELVDTSEINPDLIKQAKNTIKHNQKFVDVLNDAKSLKEYKQKQAEKLKKQNEQLKRELNKVTKDKSITDLAYLAYDYYSSLDSTLKTKLKRYLNPKNDLSFIWLDNATVRTSQNITVDAKEVHALLKLWEHGKLKHGMKCGYYTILSITDTHVKCGCHLIPTENLKALLNDFNSLKQVA